MTDLKAHLHHYLRAQRSALRLKLDGLSERDARLPRTPTGTNLLGLYKHCGACELGYFGETFGRPSELALPWDAEGVDEEGEPIEVVDRFKEKVMAAAARQHEEPLAFLEDESFFGDLRHNERFTTAYLGFLTSLHDKGARATLEDHVRG